MVKEEEDPEMSTGQVSIPLLPRTSTRGVLMIGGHTLPVGVITDGLGGGTFVCDPSDTSDNMKTIESLVSETLSNNTFSNSSCNQVPLSPSNLTTLGAKKTTDSPVSPPAITSAPTNTSTVPLIPANDQGLAVESLRPCDDISIDLRKLGGGPGRSVKLELRELLDLVMAAAQPHFNLPSLPPAGNDSIPHSRSPVGLITQLLWRSRALDDRGPWILTFAMWWMLQHYFGIGSRVHHVRLRWGHLRLVSGLVDPMTGQPCEAVEYQGPTEFATVRPAALLEATAVPDGMHISTPRRRVYPSSGWAEPEIAVAEALLGGVTSDFVNPPPPAGSQLAGLRPLDIAPVVPAIPNRPGPDFVALYKRFARHRQASTLKDDSPFYLQPLQTSVLTSCCPLVLAWYSETALGKNRIGALMRNVVDKVVRPNLSRVATSAMLAAANACSLAAQRAAVAIGHLCLVTNTLPNVVSVDIGMGLSGMGGIGGMGAISGQVTSLSRLNYLLGLSGPPSQPEAFVPVTGTSASGSASVSSVSSSGGLAGGAAAVAAAAAASLAAGRLQSPSSCLVSIPASGQTTGQAAVGLSASGHALPMQACQTPSGQLILLATSPGGTNLSLPNASAVATTGGSSGMVGLESSSNLLTCLPTGQVSHARQRPQPQHSHQHHQHSPQQQQQLQVAQSAHQLNLHPGTQTQQQLPLHQHQGQALFQTYQPGQHHSTSHSRLNHHSNQQSQQQQYILVQTSGSNLSQANSSQMNYLPLACDPLLAFNVTTKPEPFESSPSMSSSTVAVTSESATTTPNTIATSATTAILITTTPCDTSATVTNEISPSTSANTLNSVNSNNIVGSTVVTTSGKSDICQGLRPSSPSNQLEQTTDGYQQNNWIDQNELSQQHHHHHVQSRDFTLLPQNHLSTFHTTSNDTNLGCRANQLQHHLLQQQQQQQLQIPTTSSSSSLSSMQHQHHQQLSCLGPLDTHGMLQPTSLLTTTSAASSGITGEFSTFSPIMTSHTTNSASSSPFLLAAPTPDSQQIAIAGNHFNLSDVNLVSGSTATTSASGSHLGSHITLSEEQVVMMQQRHVQAPQQHHHHQQQRQLSSQPQHFTLSSHQPREQQQGTQSQFSSPIHQVYLHHTPDFSGTGFNSLTEVTCLLPSSESGSNQPGQMTSCQLQPHSVTRLRRLGNKRPASRKLRHQSTSIISAAMPSHVSSNRSRRSKKRPKRLVLSRVNQGTGEAGEEEDDDEEDEEDSEGIIEDVVNAVNATRGVLFEEEEDDGEDEDVDEEGEKDPEEQDEVAVDADRGNHIIGSMPYSVSRSSTRTRLRTRMDNATLPMTTVATQSLLPGELNLLEPGLRLVPMLGPFPSAPPAELVKSFEEVISSTSAFQCPHFYTYIMQLVRAGVLGLSRPWCLNFAAWLINTLVFGVENRSEHLALRLGDFRIVTHLPHTAATQANVHGPAGDAGLAREYVHFTNRATGSEFYLAGSATLTATTERQHGVRGRRDREVRRLRGGKSPGISMVESELNLPCPVAVFKELRSRRPGSCMEPFSKLYLQPRSFPNDEALKSSQIWFTDHAWGKNKLGGLFAEAARQAGLPMVWLRKRRARNFFPGGGGSGLGVISQLAGGPTSGSTPAAAISTDEPVPGTIHAASGPSNQLNVSPAASADHIGNLILLNEPNTLLLETSSVGRLVSEELTVGGLSQGTGQSSGSPLLIVSPMILTGGQTSAMVKMDQLNRQPSNQRQHQLLSQQSTLISIPGTQQSVSLASRPTNTTTTTTATTSTACFSSHRALVMGNSDAGSAHLLSTSSAGLEARETLMQEGETGLLSAVYPDGLSASLTGLPHGLDMHNLHHQSQHQGLPTADPLFSRSRPATLQQLHSEDIRHVMQQAVFPDSIPMSNETTDAKIDN